MSADAFDVAELLLSGFKCGHVMMLLALREQGRDNPELVRAMSGLALGLGQGGTCGALTGAICTMGLVGGKGTADEPDDPRLAAALDDLTGWFHAAMTARHGGANCSDIMRFDETRKATICPALMLETWQKTIEVLDAQGLDMARPVGAD